MICEHRGGETFYLNVEEDDESVLVWCPDCGALCEDGKWREAKRPLASIASLVAQPPLPGDAMVTILGGFHPANWVLGIKP